MAEEGAGVDLTPVQSTNLSHVGRCADGHLYVRFHRGGEYRYVGEADAHHAALISAESPGRYLNHNGLRGKKWPE